MQAINSAANPALAMISRMEGKPQGKHQSPLILSVEPTPTALSTSFEDAPAATIARELTGGELEIYGGNYPVCGLQKIHTGLIAERDVAHRVLATVISYYPGRGEMGGGEAMCGAGGIAMSKDTGPSGGYGDVIPWVGASGVTAQRCEWTLGRCSRFWCGRRGCRRPWIIPASIIQQEVMVDLNLCPESSCGLLGSTLV
jgi:hypothetical protein